MDIADKSDVMYNKPVTDRVVNFAQQLPKRISFQAVNGLQDCCYVPVEKDGCTSSKLVSASKLVLASILVLHSLLIGLDWFLLWCVMQTLKWS